MAEGHIQLQPGRRPTRRSTPPHTILPLRRISSSSSSSHLSNSISCWYCDFKTSVFNQPLFHFGQNYSRWLRIWFSIGMGFSLTTLISVTIVIMLELARVLNLYNGIPWLNNILNGSIFGFYSPVLKYSISVTDIGYICISTIISVAIHELGHALAATSEGIQIEYTAVFLAVLFPGALVAFNHELLEMKPRVATLRIYCAGIWHNAALCVVCALTLFMLPFILYPLYSHGEGLMVLDVSAESPLYNYLYPGDLITKLDGKHISTSNEWMETLHLLDKQIFQMTNYYISNKGYCVPNLMIAESRNAEIVDDQFKCPNELTLFTTISCMDLSRTNDSSNGSNQLTRENVYCFPAKGVLGEKKCGDGWDNTVNNYTNCLCTDEDESCMTPIHTPDVSWVEISFSRRCSSYNSSGSEENRCGGTFVFMGDMMLMAHSIRLTEYKPRLLFGLGYVPVVVEKLLINTFHVSLMLALLNSLPVYYLDGESILEVALCCFGSMTPRIREAVLRSSLLVGTIVCVLLNLRILLLVTT
ncbi:membrane-bound transcription factor site-2 protease homolog [Rutidosis leptorrhynchoides]|uniref:membrane-bound transcription factor site-2 protease homolog n=1 Tax=Rutidosis leptorrhynchoides TaxID=125765 RepID=UPI003A99C83D